MFMPYMYVPFHGVSQTQLVMFCFQTVRSHLAVGRHGRLPMDCASIPFSCQRAIYLTIKAILLHSHGRPAFSLVKHLSVSVCVRNVRLSLSPEPINDRLTHMHI